ncbi:hypothetical protein SCACP_21740 [Sporomusa carbonis]|uniref:hypothetical protein n=1 Tax=Sporomusa carbonis TaxID=3076075 RepID=UPI003A67BDE2
MAENTVYLSGEAQARFLLGKEIVNTLFTGKAYSEIKAETEVILKTLEIISKKYDVNAIKEIILYGQIYAANFKK